MKGRESLPQISHLLLEPMQLGSGLLLAFLPNPVGRGRLKPGLACLTPAGLDFCSQLIGQVDKPAAGKRQLVRFIDLYCVLNFDFFLLPPRLQ